MKKQLLNLRFGNRAFIFSLDIVIAIAVVMSLLMASTFYVSKAGGESVAKLQTIRIGADVLAILDYNGTLNTLDLPKMEVELNNMLPINYHMRIRSSCKGQGPLVVETTDDYPTDRFVGSGKRVFVTNSSQYCIATYSIWLK